MPFLLHTYILTQILAPFLASLLVLTGVLFLGNLLPLLEVIIGYSIQPADFIRLYAYLSPQLLLFTIPMASMMGVILGATRMTNDGEIGVLKSCGISLAKMLPAVILVACSTAALTGLFSISLMPAGSIAKNKLLYQLAKEKIDQGLQAKQFSQSLGEVVLFADRIEKDSGEWTGVFVSDLRDHDNPVVIMAQHGRIATSLQQLSLSLFLEDGSMHRTAGNISQSIDFKTYQLSLPIASPTGNPVTRTGKAGMNLAQLSLEAHRLGLSSKIGADLMREYHKRLVLPVSCFIMTLLGFSLGLLASPGHRTIGIPIGLFVFTLYYILLTAAEAMSEAVVLPVAVAMWLPNIIFLVLTLLLLRLTSQEKTTVLIEQADDLWLRFTARLFARRRGHIDTP